MKLLFAINNYQLYYKMRPSVMLIANLKNINNISIFYQYSNNIN